MKFFFIISFFLLQTYNISMNAMQAPKELRDVAAALKSLEDGLRELSLALNQLPKLAVPTPAQAAPKPSQKKPVATKEQMEKEILERMEGLLQKMQHPAEGITKEEAEKLKKEIKEQIKYVVERIFPAGSVPFDIFFKYAVLVNVCDQSDCASKKDIEWYEFAGSDAALKQFYKDIYKKYLEKIAPEDNALVNSKALEELLEDYKRYSMEEPTKKSLYNIVEFLSIVFEVFAASNVAIVGNIKENAAIFENFLLFILRDTMDRFDADYAYKGNIVKGKFDYTTPFTEEDFELYKYALSKLQKIEKKARVYQLKTGKGYIKLFTKGKENIKKAIGQNPIKTMKHSAQELAFIAQLKKDIFGYEKEYQKDKEQFKRDANKAEKALEAIKQYNEIQERLGQTQPVKAEEQVEKKRIDDFYAELIKKD